MTAIRKRKCAAQGCKESFTPVLANQVYHSRKCANREKQRRLRERAKLATAQVVTS